MNKFRLSSDNTVLVIIDLQEKLMAAMKDKEKVFNNTNILLAAAKEFNLPVIQAEQYPKGLGPTAEEVKKNLPDVRYIEKVCFSICSQEIMDYLKELGRTNILVTGSETHVCVYQTVRDLIEAKYNVHVIRDAVCSRFDLNHESGLEMMKQMGAVINNTETVVFDLLKGSDAPQFKIMSRMVK